MKVSYQPVRVSEGASSDGFSVRYGRARRAGYKLRWYGLLLVIISPIALVVWLAMEDSIFIQAEGILTLNPQAVQSMESGLVQTVKPVLGTRVMAGEVVVEISSYVLDQEIAYLREQISILEQSVSDARQQHVAIAQHKLSSSKAHLSEQEQVSESYRAYREKGVVSLSEQMGINQEIHTAKQNVMEVQQEQIRSNQEFESGHVFQSLLALRMKLVALESRREQMNIRAPVDGVVTEIFVQPGDAVVQNQSLLRITRSSEADVVAYLDPKRIDYAEIGQLATVTFPNGKHYRAIVSMPTQVTQKLPSVLVSPFDRSQVALKVVMNFIEGPSTVVEGLPVSIRFNFVGQDQAASWFSFDRLLQLLTEWK